MINGEFGPHQPLSHMQKDLRLAITMSDMVDDPVAITAAANESFKQAKWLGLSDHDSSAVYVRTKLGI